MCAALRGSLVAAVAALAIGASAQPGPAGTDHSDPCHPSHSCPSDHHSYRWNGLSCTSYRDERLPTDTKVVVYAGRAYWCSGSGAATVGAVAGSGSGESCGVERWTVKTLQDRPSLLPVERTTVASLVRLPPPESLSSARLAFERHIFQVAAAVVLVRGEADGDLHVVLVAGHDHMIAEAPSPSCTGSAAPLRREEMARARGSVRVCARALVTGVAFFDFRHGQTGVAPNAVELHPILAFRCLE